MFVLASAASNYALGADVSHRNPNLAKACDVPRKVVTTAPDTTEGPVKVGISVFLLDFVEIDERKGSFKVDVIFKSRWRDPRLSASSRGRTLAGCDLKLDDIWSPGIGTINLRTKPDFWYKNLSVDDQGNVTFAARVQVTLSSSLDLREFPFDTQHLNIQLASFDYGPRDVVFVDDEAETGRLESASIAGWKLLSNTSNASVAALKAVNGERSQIVHTITLKRQSEYYILNYVIPLCFIVLMASSVFWLDPAAFGNQVGIATASVFTLVAFLLGVRQGLPQVNYLTRMDVLVLGAIVLVFISFAEVIYAGRLVKQERTEFAQRLDWHARWIHLLIFSVLLFATLVVR